MSVCFSRLSFSWDDAWQVTHMPTSSSSIIWCFSKTVVFHFTVIFLLTLITTFDYVISLAVQLCMK